MKESKFSLGVSVDASKIIAGIIDTRSASVVEFAEFRISEASKDIILHKLIETIVRVVCKARLNIMNIQSLGVCVAGTVDRESGLVSADNIGFHDVELKSILEKYFRIPVFIGSKAEAFALSELKFGFGADCESVVYILAENNISACAVEQGQLKYGYSGKAGDIGKMTVVPDGNKCECGGYGSLNAYASKIAIHSKIKSASRRSGKSYLSSLVKGTSGLDVDALNKLVKSGDETAATIVSDAAGYLGIALANIAKFYNPQTIVVGGELIHKLDSFLDRINQKVNSLYTPSNDDFIRKAVIGEYAGIIGAAMFNTVRASVEETKVMVK